jgi:two-component system, OmpR family, phosphate regulon sensor histidine kinase PhoR
VKPLKVRWRFFLSFLLLTAVTLAVLAWISAVFLRRVYLEQVSENLELKARLASRLIETSLAAGSYDRVREECRALSRDLDARFTVILPSGEVAADSHEDPARMSNHGVREEIIAALAGNTATVEHFSFTLHRDMLYLALPWWQQGRVAAVIRVAIPAATVSGHVLRLYRRLGLGFLGGLALTALLGLLLAVRAGRPWEDVVRSVRRFAQGDLTAKVPVSPETRALAEDLNRMAAELDQRLRTVVRQQHEQEAVLAAMVEGVVVVDAQTRVHTLNQAAETLFGISASQAIGRLLPEVVRNSALLELVDRSLASDSPVEGEVPLAGPPERFLQAHGTKLRDAQGRPGGSLLVLHDLTRLRRLESVRKEFVANVSHELKTPITAIKGFLETLQDGSVHRPEDIARFMQIMSAQAARLDRIIEDLLNLSRLEQDAEQGRIEVTRQTLRPILTAAIAACQLPARTRQVAVELDCPEDLAAAVNSRLLEQALINLIDNAVKYSDPGARVEVFARGESQEVIVGVRDHGIGIEAEHLPRLFERFYRVDKGRSREQGGTGLGLAIVKHILQAHGGHATVESTVGNGSTFSLHLPLP